MEGLVLLTIQRYKLLQVFFGGAGRGGMISLC